MSRRSVPFLCVIGFLALPLLSFAADQDIWALLKSGGQIILMRHAVTTPGSGDPPGMTLDDCSSQRNLTDQGREDARRVGAAFRSRSIPVARVLSSPWCRCQETARVAFAEPELWDALGNLFDRPEKAAAQVAAFRMLAGNRPVGGNLVLVTHGSTISAFVGISPDPAEMVVITPEPGGKYRVAGRLRVP